MVFLRLSIKVFPREQLAPSSSSSWPRALLGGRKSTTDDSSQGSTASTTLKKPGVFLLVLENPEAVSLGGLAGMIQEHWAKLHPELESLSIKKILDDTKEDIDLHPDLTVADVWVDYGKARADGLDQRGSVRVLQKPTSAAPERFPSVDQDWDAAIAAYEHKRAAQVKKEAMERQFPAIQEEDEESNDEWQRSQSRSLTRSQPQWEHSPASPQHTDNIPPASTQKSPVERRHRDLPLSSVEGRSPVITPPPAKPTGPTIAATPPLRRESEELGESPSPAEQRASTPRSQISPSSIAAASPKLQTQPRKIVKLPIATTTAKRTITQMPDDAEPSVQVISNELSNEQTQSTEEATASSSEESEPETAPDQIVKLPIKSRMTNGQGHLAAVAKSVSRSPQKKQAEPVILSSSEESSEEEKEDENDKNVPEKKIVQQDDQGEETGSDESASDSDSGSDSDSEASEDDRLKDEPITPQIDRSIPVNVENESLIDVDADGDVQMETSVVTTGSRSSDASDLSRSQTNSTTRNTRSLKRKQGSEEPASVKQARQGQSYPSIRQQSKSKSPKPVPVPEVVVSPQCPRQSKSKSPLAVADAALPTAPVSPQRRRDRAPSFSSPARRASIREEFETIKSPQFGLGLGITRSPPSKQPAMLDLSQDSVGSADLPFTQHSFGEPLFPSSNATVTGPSSFTSVNKQTPALGRAKKLPSAIRAKDSPASERRSVSFAEGDNLASSLDTAVRSTPRIGTISSKPTPISIVKATQGTPASATPRNATTKAKSAQQTPTPAARSAKGTPSTATPKANANNRTHRSTTSSLRETQTSHETVYPPGIDVAKMKEDIEKEKHAKAMAREAEKEQKEKEKMEKEQLERKIRQNDDPHILILLTEMKTYLERLSNSRLDKGKRTVLRSKLEDLRKEVKTCEQKLEAKKSNPRESVARQPRPTLKDMLSSQKQELAAKTAKPRVETKSAPAPRADVYEVPSSSESESDSSGDDSSSDGSESESESGDIMPDGHSEKLRKPWSQRS